jgi:hypothetical protein
MLIGQAVNVFMPARAGDIVRSALVETENAAYVLGTQMMTLAADLLMTSVLVLLLLTRIETPQWMRRPGELLLAVGALTLFGMIVLAYGSKYLQRALQWLEGKWSWPRGLGVLAMIREFLRSFILLKSPWLLITLSVITVVLWTLYTFVNWVLLEAAGVSLQWPESAAAALFVLVVLQLGVAVPTSPGRVGVYHFLAVQALAVFSVDQPMAVSFSILVHLISVIIPAGIGVLLAWRMGLTVGKPKWEGG